MGVEDAIGHLKVFAARYGRQPEPGKTLESATGQFESVLHVLRAESGEPIWAWINSVAGDGNALGYYFLRKGNPISFGDVKNPRPPASYEEKLKLPLT